MKVLICGKGGCGKSATTALLAKEMAARGFKTLVVDNDESNFGLHSQLGIPLPRYLIEHFGGRKAAAKKLFEGDSKSVFQSKWSLRDIPREHVNEKESVTLLAIGKIHEFAEGCACPMNALTSDFLRNLELAEDELVLVDADAGIEHFGRGVEESCDLVLTVIDPTEESIRLAGRISHITEQIDKELHYVLNKVDERTESILLEKVGREKVVAAIPRDSRIFECCLAGEELDFTVDGIGDVADMLVSYSSGVRG